jgi:multicomponent Na+:H+ antiporter subunit F
MENGMFEQLMLVLLAVLAASLIVTVLRLLSGPDLLDRVVAFEVIVMHIVGLVALYALAVQRLVLLDVMMGIAVAALLSTLALVHHIERGRK